MSTQSVTALILAAGKGTRMKSNLPKCLHPVAGVPMVKLVADEMRGAGVGRIIIVVGHGGEAIIEALGDQYEYAWQLEQNGTGHAVQCALEAHPDLSGDVLIACGDTPLIGRAYFADFIRAHQESGCICTVAVAEMASAMGYGRVVLEGGRALRIVEQKDASDDEMRINYANAGMYCVDAGALKSALKGLTPNNSQGEYYLTDIIEAFNAQGQAVHASISDNPDIMMGVNTRWHLAEANQICNRRTLERLMDQGVTILDPGNTYIGPYVEIGADTVIDPGTHILGECVIGGGCTIGPNAWIIDSEIGANCTIWLSAIRKSKIGNDVTIGPYANVRPGSSIGNACRIGNFVEINRSHLGGGVKASHLSYLGDATVGEDSNIGAGTITCNFDGFRKFETSIGSNVFIGSNNTLIAPLAVGDGAITAAGSVIYEAVPENSGAFGRAVQVTKEGWAARWRAKKKGQTHQE